MGVHAVEERDEGTIVSGIGHEPVGHDHLMGGIDRNLPVIALYEPVAGRQDPAIWIREVALRTIGRAAVLSAQDSTLPAHARRSTWSALVIRVGRISGFCFQRRLGGSDRLQAALLVSHPGGHLIAALVGPMLVVLGCIRLIGLNQPGVHLGGEGLLGYLHPGIAHRFMARGVGLQLGPVHGHMPELHKPCARHNRRTWTKRSERAARWRLRKSAMVRKSGRFRPVTAMTSTRSSQARAS